LPASHEPRGGGNTRRRFRPPTRAPAWLARFAAHLAEPSPARQHQAPAEPVSKPETHAADLLQDAGAGPGRYSGYSEDTAADNVSSPKPRTRRGYSEDTQNGAGDNGIFCRVV